MGPGNSKDNGKGSRKSRDSKDRSSRRTDPAVGLSRRAAPQAAVASSSRATTLVTPAAPLGPMINTTPTMNTAIRSEAINAIWQAANGLDHRIVGGVALAHAFGSPRGTKDVDVLVPNDTGSVLVQALLASGKFGVKYRNSSPPQVWYKASNGNNYNIDIIEPKRLHPTLEFPYTFKPGTNIAVPEAADLLNLKILAYLYRRDQSSTDAEDIVFLVRYMTERKIKVKPGQVQYADADFLMEFVTMHNSATRKYWIAIGLPPP